MSEANLKGISEWSTLAVAVATIALCGITWWYASTTKRQLTLATAQNTQQENRAETENRPWLDVTLMRTEYEYSSVSVVNVGRGAAIAVRLSGQKPPERSDENWQEKSTIVPGERVTLLTGCSNKPPECRLRVFYSDVSDEHEFQDFWLLDMMSSKRLAESIQKPPKLPSVEELEKQWANEGAKAMTALKAKKAAR